MTVTEQAVSLAPGMEIPLWIQNGSFSSYNDRSLIDTLLSPGIPEKPQPGLIIPPTVTDLAVSLQTSTPPVCAVAPGTVVITGSDQTRQGNYLCRATSAQSVSLDARPASGSRIDRVFAQVIDTSAGISGNDGWVIAKISGVASATPTPPALPTSSELLAQVTVPSGAGAITVLDQRRRSFSGVYPPMGMMAWGNSIGQYDTSPANSPQSIMSLTATLPPGTYKVSGKIQTTTITAVPLWINGVLSGSGIGAGIYILAENLQGTSLGNVWANTNFGIITLAAYGTYSWNITASVGGNGAIRTAAGNATIIVERIK